MNILITICARGGSKGIPGKNIKLLNGKPLLAYTIETAKAFAEKYATVITLSTDSRDIKAVASRYGLETNYERPSEFATDKAGKIAAIEHIKEYEEILKGIQFDYIIDLDITSPLRTVEDIEKSLEQLKDNAEAYNLFSVSPASRNPYFNMVEESEKGYAKLIKESGSILSRQSAPKVFDMNASFCIFRPSFFATKQSRSTTDKSIAFVVPHLCFDLDNPTDFLIMEFLLQQNLLDFTL